MYETALEEANNKPPQQTTFPPCNNDSEELREQIRDMAGQIQELEIVRADLGIRLQHQSKGDPGFKSSVFRTLSFSLVFRLKVPRAIIQS